MSARLIRMSLTYSLYSELEKVSHRVYFPGFYFENGKTSAGLQFIKIHFNV